MRQLQMVLKKLEQEVAQVKLNGDRGFTAPGQFLFDLFTKYVSSLHMYSRFMLLLFTHKFNHTIQKKIKIFYYFFNFFSFFLSFQA